MTEMKTIGTIALLLMLSGCGEDRPRYGFEFVIYCGDVTMSYISDKDGRVKSLLPQIYSRVFFSYGGGMFQNGIPVPLELREDCRILRGGPTIWVNGFPSPDA
jgi:hypothetical protein